MSLSIICMTECVNYFSGVGSDQIIWGWREDGETYARTNTYTIFSLRIFGDLNFDDIINSSDYAGVKNLTAHGWAMPVASNTLRKVELKTDLLIPGHLILSLTGDAQLRIWTTATPAANDTPLLITGQSITKGVDGASFGAYPVITLYVEAISSGIAILTYSYVGTGSADGFGYQEKLTITAIKVDLDIWNGGADLDNGGNAPIQGEQVPEAEENDIGAYLLVNWDDDDGDGVVSPFGGGWISAPVSDLTEMIVIAEDNLAKLKPRIEPSLNSGFVELEVLGVDRDSVKLWESSSKVTPVILVNYKKIWDLSDLVEKNKFEQYCSMGLWIEGIEKGSVDRGITFRLTYKENSISQSFEDTCKATVVMINLANAVYRQQGLPFVDPNRGHAALVGEYTGACTRSELQNDANYVLFEVTGGRPSAVRNLTNTTQNSSLTCFGCYSTPDMNYVNRLTILAVARFLINRGSAIGYTGVNVLRPASWNSNLNTISNLRCDGYVEVCYEISGLFVWGAIVNGTIGYDICNNTFQIQHDDFDNIFWKDTLNGSTQCGFENTYRGVSWQTGFATQNLCVPIGSTGGN